jgi:hypothetical protein
MASIRTAALTKDLGEMRAVVDYTREDFADGQRRYDVILDVGGASTLSRLRRALAPTGTTSLHGGQGRVADLGVVAMSVGRVDRDHHVGLQPVDHIDGSSITTSGPRLASASSDSSSDMPETRSPSISTRSTRRTVAASRNSCPRGSPCHRRGAGPIQARKSHRRDAQPPPASGRSSRRPAHHLLARLLGSVVLML